MVVDLEKEKEAKVRDQTLAVGWLDSPQVRLVIYSMLAASAKSDKKWSNVVI